jgi:hypothetical protein
MQCRCYYLTTLSEWTSKSAQFTASHYILADLNRAATPGTRILVIVEADEGAHNSLSQDSNWQELPHPLSPRMIPANVADELSSHGVTTFNTMFEALEAIAMSHPILRHRVF